MKLRHSILCGLLVSTMLAGVPAALAQSADVLDMIPSSAWGAIVLRDLKKIDDKIVAVGKELGLPIGPDTMVGDPLTLLKGRLGAAEGLDDSGSIALVMLKMEAVEAEGLTKSIVILVPSKDPKAFLEQFAAEGGAKTEGDKPKEDKPEGEKAAAPDKPKLPEGVVAVQFMGEESFGAVKGNYAVVAPSPEAIEAFLKAEPGKGLKDRLGKLGQKSDLLFWFNIAAAGPVVKDKVNEFLMGMMMLASMGNPGAATQARSLIENVQKFLEQSEDFVFAIGIDKPGFDLAFDYRAKPDTELGKMLAAQKTSKESLLKALPGEAFFIALGMVGSSSEDKVKEARKTIDGLLENPTIKEKCDAAKLAELKEAIGQLLDLGPQVKNVSMSVSRLPQGDDGMFGLTVVAEAPGIGDKWIKGMRKVVKTALELCPDEESKKYLSKVQYKEDQKIGDATVDEISFDLKEIPGLDEKDVETTKKLIGKDGLVLRLAMLDPDHAAVVFGGGPKRIEQLAALVKEGKAPLADDAGVKNVAQFLPEGEKSFEMYVCGDTIMRVINDAAVAAGEEKPIQMEIPEINAPLTVVATTTSNAMQAHVFIPLNLVKGIKDVIMGTMAAKAMPMEKDKEEAPAEDSDKPEKKPADESKEPAGGAVK